MRTPADIAADTADATDTDAAPVDGARRADRTPSCGCVVDSMPLPSGQQIPITVSRCLGHYDG